jgi:hypothetical protein
MLEAYVPLFVVHIALAATTPALGFGSGWSESQEESRSG